MKSSTIIGGGIGLAVVLSTVSYFLYKKFGEDEDENEIRKTRDEASNAYGYTPTTQDWHADGGKKTRHKKHKKGKNTRRKIKNKK
jgi:hypothetical protein